MAVGLRSARRWLAPTGTLCLRSQGVTWAAEGEYGDYVPPSDTDLAFPTGAPPVHR